jgi:hypothetical protein
MTVSSLSDECIGKRRSRMQGSSNILKDEIDRDNHDAAPANMP